MSNVILIGYMGCGKSTVGIRLSYWLKQPFLDTDKLIEKKEKTTITEIFDTKGEAYFRQMETDCVKELLKEKGSYVIATGGGLAVREENRRLLGKLGTVVYLRIRPETVYERLKNDTGRPLLRTEDPLAKITSMIKERSPFYEECADVIIDVDDKSFEQILRQIVKNIRTLKKRRLT
ncbi:MAG: shikimate kinase [Lachnospiraceae bacterium]|nr:shikimate kinase [Lachnospiraceae bacterium]